MNKKKQEQKVYILWAPPLFLLPRGSLVIGFLTPVEENSLKLSSEIVYISARCDLVVSRDKAIEVYRHVVRQIGLAQFNSSQSARQVLAIDAKNSTWWYHQVAMRDSEGDRQFDWITQVLFINHIAEKRGIKNSIVIGGQYEVVEMLRQFLKVETVSNNRTKSIYFKSIIWALGSRIRFFSTFVLDKIALGRCYQLPSNSFRLVFSSFWDWAICFNSATGRISDRYFKRIPHLLSDSGIVCGYFAWFAPSYEPNQKGRTRSCVLAPLIGNPNVVILQAMLTFKDVILALFDFSSFKVIRTILHKSECVSSFVSNGLDWKPIFYDALLRGSLNSQIPFCVLVEIATHRAGLRYKTCLTLSFLEHYPYSRAHYAGMNNFGSSAQNWAMQHALRNREKTFDYLDPIAEYNGEPDGCKVPKPDRVFVMGELGREIFLECGYNEAQVQLIGSARYDHINVGKPKLISSFKKCKGKVKILLACSLHKSTELSMVEAINLATDNLSMFDIRLRNHPSSRIDDDARFSKMRLSIKISGDSLIDDIIWCDLVVFSYSSVAEEAYVSGKPTWQWLPIGFNGSALASIIKIPQFSSVQNLRSALINFSENPLQYIPSDESRHEVAKKLFYPADGKSAERITAECLKYLREHSSENSH